MTQPGRASITIVGDVSDLGRQLKRDAQRAVDNLDLDTEHIADEVGDGFREGAIQAIDAFDEIDEHFERTSARIKRNADDAFEDIGEKVRETGDDVQRTFLRPVTQGFTKLGDVIGSAASAAAGFALTGTNPAGLVSIALTVTAITAAIPLVIGLVAALADLAGLITVLPGLIGTLASSLVVVTIAFQGFGDALGAIIDGDPEKIAEAMEKLAPAARQVASEFQAALPLFRQVGDSIQQEFFEPLVGQLTGFATRILPRIRGELDTLAQALGRAFGHFGDIVTDTENAGILERLLAATTTTVDRLGVAFANLGQSFLNAIDAGLPSLDRLTEGLANGIDNFASFINKSIEDGSFQEFFDEAVDTLGRLFDLGKAVGDLLGTLFAGTDEGGRDFIDTLTDLTQRLTEFFKSAEGQEALQDFEEIIGAIGSILGYVVNVTREVIDIFTELDDAVEATIQFFTDLWDGIVEAWNGITSATSSAADSVGQFFTDLWADITEIWDGIVEGVSNAVDSVIDFFTELPGRIWEAIQAIPGLIAALFESMIDQAISILAAGIAVVIVYFTDLPGQIEGAFTALLDFLGGVWDSITTAVADAVVQITMWFTGLPGELEEAGTSLMQWAEDTWNSIVETVLTAFNSVVEFFRALPGRIGEFFGQLVAAVVARGSELVAYVRGIPGRIGEALGNTARMLFDSGRKIIQGLIDGISSKIGQLREKIASAVQTIRDHLPFSPAKIGPLSGSGSPALAGAKIAAMIAEGLDSGQPLVFNAAGRTAGAVADAGVTPLVSATPGAPAPVLSPVQQTVGENQTIVVQIGDQQFQAYIVKTVEKTVQVEARRLMAGARGTA